MEPLLYLILALLCLIYTKQTTGYHPKWLNYFKKTERRTVKDSILNITVEILFVSKDTGNRVDEEITSSSEIFGKSFAISDGLCWSCVTSSDEWLVEKYVDKNILEKIFCVKNTNELGYKYHHFSNSSVHFICEKERGVTQIRTKNKFYVGDGWLDINYQGIVLFVYCNEECYESIKIKFEKNQHQSIRFNCDFQLTETRLEMSIQDYKFYTPLSYFDNTIQHRFWNDDEIKSDDKIRYQERFPAYAQLYDRVKRQFEK